MSAGQLKGTALQQRFIEADEFCRLVDALIDLRLVEAHILRAEGDVLIARFLKELVLRVLEHQTRQETEIPDLFRLGPEVAAINDDLAAGGFVQTVHVGDEGALAGAGGTDDAHKISLFHLKAHVIQRGDGIGHSRVIDITQVIYFDNASHLPSPPLLQKLIQSLCARAGVDDALGHGDARSSAACGTSSRRARTFSVWLNTSFGVPSMTTLPLLITSTRSA